MNTFTRSLARFRKLGRLEEATKLSEIGATLIKSILYLVLGFVLLKLFPVVAILLLITGAAFLVVPRTARIIPTGHHALIMRFGVATKKTIGAGLTVRIPFIRDILLFETRIKSYTYQFACVTQDQKRVLGAMKFSYQLDDEMLKGLFTEFGTDYQAVMMDALVSSFFSEALSKTDSSNLLSTYDGIKSKVTESLLIYGVNISLPVIDIIVQP
jgi:regulator of protease activity HflC (stomatin/prohibitin superfamily)